jgi:hypothetical protein
MEIAGNEDFGVCQPTSMLMFLGILNFISRTIDGLLDPSNLLQTFNVWVVEVGVMMTVKLWSN